MTVLAIFAADLHQSHARPAGRADSNWYESQKQSLTELGHLKEKSGCPIFYAGDVTHAWNLPPEAINFLLKWLPDGYAIPGNHDLPNHSLDEIHRSAYWTLVQARKLVHLSQILELGQLRVHPFPFGSKIRPLRQPHSLAYEVALVHSYVWVKDASHVGASAESAYRSIKPNLSGYNWCFFGDNHIHFTRGSCCNLGLFQRRRADERNLNPSVMLLLEDGTIARHFLNTDFEVWNEVEEIAKPFDASSLVGELNSLEYSQISFEDRVHQAIKGVDEQTKQEILGAMKQ
jgi:hypothetical protein